MVIINEKIKCKLESLLASSLSDLKIVLSNKIGAQKAIASFYKSGDMSEQTRLDANKVYEIISKAKLKLDSVCYVEMVKTI